MQEAFSFNREYDYVRREGLSRTTGVPAHEWDLYILKELIDNALDADELLWSRDQSHFPFLRVGITYMTIPQPPHQQLMLRVGNRAPFPVRQIPAIFNTRWYASRKAFMKGVTRGTLGNALKTLLGIPYALHNSVFDDWTPGLKPLSIRSGEIEYLPRYVIDPTRSSIHCTIEMKKCPPLSGTLVSVGLDYFVQEVPRTFEEIEVLAQLYHLCNPHTAFHWTIEMGNHVWEKKYSPELEWTYKFQGIAPVQWYSLTGFKDLLRAIYRELFGDEQERKLPIPLICRYFSGFYSEVSTDQNALAIISIIQRIERDGLTMHDIDGSSANSLYSVLNEYRLPFHPSQLGYLGKKHVCSVMAESLSIKGNIQYAIAGAAEDDPSTPFVIEVAAAYLKEGKRQIWTAINFSPTHSDPFLDRWLYTATPPNTPVLGLRGLLDAYNFGTDLPVVLFLHLVCPTIEFNEFSKTEINHMPFKKILGEVLDRLLRELRRVHEEEEIRLEQSIFQALDTILTNLIEGERFLPEQMLERLRQQLSHDPALVKWMERSDAANRLMLYLNSYQSSRPELTSYVAYQAEAFLYVPLHPTHHFSIPVEYISQDFLTQHSVSKILYLHAQQLEPMIVANNWLCRMDMALLHPPSRLSLLEEALLQCVCQTDLPLLILHDSDEEGYSLVERVRGWLQQQGMESQRIMDLTPRERMSADDGITPTKLMPHTFEAWLLRRFDALGIEVKYSPSYIGNDIHNRFEQLLHRYLLERLEHRFELTNLLDSLNAQFSYTNMMMGEALDEQLKHRLKQSDRTESYTTIFNTIVEEFFERFMNEHKANIEQMEQRWLQQKYGDYA